MGREQLDRTKRFTDDGKMRGIISSAKFVPKYEDEEMQEIDGFGELFRVKGRRDVDVERELEVCDDEDKVVKKRRVGFDQVQVSKVLDFKQQETSNAESETQKRKRSKLVVLKIPNLAQASQNGTKERRRVQFADV